jgi:hypothetical protein
MLSMRFSLPNMRDICWSKYTKKKKQSLVHLYCDNVPPIESWSKRRRGLEIDRRKGGGRGLVDHFQRFRVGTMTCWVLIPSSSSGLSGHGSFVYPHHHQPCNPATTLSLHNFTPPFPTPHPTPLKQYKGGEVKGGHVALGKVDNVRPELGNDGLIRVTNGTGPTLMPECRCHNWRYWLAVKMSIPDWDKCWNDDAGGIGLDADAQVRNVRYKPLATVVARVAHV